MQNVLGSIKFIIKSDNIYTQRFCPSTAVDGLDFFYWTKERIDKYAQKFSQAVQKGWTSPWKKTLMQWPRKQY